MLLNLAIQGYAVVDRLEVDLHPGMTAITGETGAGKSIMLDALGLCVGDRADPKAVRPGAARIDIAASFDVSQNTRARVWLAERDLDASGECILRRTISAEGRSRATSTAPLRRSLTALISDSCWWTYIRSMPINRCFAGPLREASGHLCGRRGADCRGQRDGAALAGTAGGARSTGG